MGFKCGIVGLPNVGKSTIFNAITNTANAQSANYPFCTIEPNVGRVAVPDNRLNKISKIASSEKIIPSFIDIVDIAGLVKGASKGEGLGNQFLANIREVDAILHVVRCFSDDDITHVENSVDPIRDIEIIDTELMLSDIATIEKRINSIAKKAKSGDKELLIEHALLEKVMSHINNGNSIRSMNLDENELNVLSKMHLITTKPVLFIANISSENQDQAQVNLVRDYAQKKQSSVVEISAKFECEMLGFDEEEKKIFLVESGFSDTGLGKIIKAGYDLLGLITFFTAGPKEARAWSIERQTSAPKAASVIHTDFEKHFIKAEVIGYDDFIEHNGNSGAKENGKIRMEGKEYIVKDGDVIHFKTAA